MLFDVCSSVWDGSASDELFDSRTPTEVHLGCGSGGLRVCVYNGP